MYGAARLTVLSTSMCLLFIFILHFLEPEMTPAAHMLSEYAIGNFGWLMKLAFFAWALGCLSLAIAIRPHVRTKAGKAGIVLLYVSTIALVMGGVFVIDPPYGQISVPTTHGSLHGLSAMIGLPAQAIAALLISYSLKRNSHWAATAKRPIVFAHFTWLSFVLMIGSTMIMMSNSNGKFNDSTAIGWFNRLLVVIYCSWLIIVAASAMRAGKKTKQ